MTLIAYIQGGIAALLILTILFQSRSTGLSATFGGSDGAFVQRRGAEKLLYQAAVVFSIAFFLLTIVDWYVLD